MDLSHIGYEIGSILW